MKNGVFKVMAGVCVLVVFGLGGCGSGGNGGGSVPSVTAVSTSGVGTYMLSSITSDMTNTSTNVRQVVTAMPSSNPPFTGTLKIGYTTWDKTLDPGDGKGTISTIGTYKFTATNDHYGAFMIENMAGTAGKVGVYNATSAYEITFEYEPENVNSNGATYKVISTEKWLKISDTP